MTLIACAVKNNIPLLISDILLSNKKGSENFRSPTNNFPLNPYLNNTTYKPHSYAQKTYILKNNFCITLAGDVSEMEKLLKELRIKCNYMDVLTFEFVKRVLDEYDFANEFKESACGVLFINHSTPFSFDTWFIRQPVDSLPFEKTSIHGDWEYLTNDIYGLVYATGSGKKSFLNIVDQKVNVFTSLEEGSLKQIIQLNLALVAKLLAFEKATIRTLLENWGGGFEIVVYDIFNMTLRKIDSIAYVINYGEFDSEGDIGLPIPKLILYYKYYDEFLYIMGITINKSTVIKTENFIEFVSEDGEHDIDLFIIPPIDYKEKHVFDDMSDLSFNTFLIAFGYDLRKNISTGTYNPSAFNFNKDELNIEFKQGESLTLTMRKEVNEVVRQKAKEVYPDI